MANEEHVKILKQGVEAWHRWRSEYNKRIEMLSAEDLIASDFSYGNFSGANLSQKALF